MESDIGGPVAAGLFITLSDASGPVGLAKEAMALARRFRIPRQAMRPRS